MLFEIIVPLELIEQAIVPDDLFDEIFGCATPADSDKLK